MKKLLLLLAFGLVALPVRAQITITEAEVRAQFGERISSTTYTADDPSVFQSLVGQTGANQTFNFQGTTYTEEETLESEVITCSAEVPGCDDSDLNTANFIWRLADTAEDSLYVSFANLDTDGFSVLGAGMQGDFDETEPGLETMTAKFSPASLLMKLPLTMGTTWENDVTFTVTGLPFDLRFIETHTVDAWGTLVTPAGSESALRVYSEEITETSVFGIITRDTSYTITYYTEGNISASLSLDSEGQLTWADYTVFETDPDIANDPDHEMPGRIVLEPNFPNPFNPSTTFSYTLNAAGPVKLTIHDLLGREVAVLVDGHRAAGTYQVTWEAQNLTSGLYLSRLTSGSEIRTRTLTLLK